MKRLVKTLAVLAVMAVAGVMAVLGLFFYISIDLPQINSLKDYNPPMNSQILSRDGEVLLDIGKETRDVVDFKDIPPRVVSAFLSAEDDNFYNHQGIDYLGIVRAFVVNMKEGRLVQGGSTITQQVAKSLLLTKERTLSRKVKDLLLARKIEQKFTKEEILFLYLNQVYLGGGYYGVKAAFRGYFDKGLKEATIAESALVAGLLVAPGRYSPYVNPKYAKIRQEYVLGRMFATGKITKEEYEAAKSENIKMRIRRPSDMKGGHFTDWVRQEVMAQVGVDQFLTEGFKVRTTLDWDLQQKAEAAVKNRIKELDKRQGFKGAIRKIESDEAISNFIKDARRSILKEKSTFFTFATDGKNIYEFNEAEDQFEKTLAFIEEEESKINERFKKIATIGNRSDESLLEFLKKGESYQAIVLESNDLKRTILASIGGVRVMIPEKGFAWAHERKLSEDPIYFAPLKTPSKIVKRGDVILVTIENTSVPVSNLIHSDFTKKYKDATLVKIHARQKVVEATLDQEPEVEGALVAIHPQSGEVMTLVGGVDFQKSQFNRVIQSARQPGSAFKPFIYAAALENGYTPTSTVLDMPQALGGAEDSLSWKPRNYDGEFKGPMTFRHALEVSRNIPAIRLLQDVGVNKMEELVARFGMKTTLPKDMTISLGSFGISLAELVRGFAVFPNGGKRIPLKSVLSIKDRNGKTYTPPIYKPVEGALPVVETVPPTVEGEAPKTIGNPFHTQLKENQVYDERLAYIMTNLMNGVVLYGTGSAAASVSRNLGGKTGTTSSFVDALFVGFSQNLVVGAWTGFDDNRTLGYGESGTRAALPMWVDFMYSAVGKYGAPEFNVPNGITQVMINKQTGRPTPAGQGGFLESFVEGYDPNSAPSTFSPNSGNDSEAPAPALDGDDYYMNQ